MSGRYNRIGDIQFGRNRETFYWMIQGACQDADLSHDFIRLAYKDGITVAQDVSRAIHAFSENEREALENADAIGARIY